MSNSSKIKMLLVAMLLAPMATHAFNVNIGNVKVEFKVLDDEKHLVQLGEGKKNRPAVAATTPGTLVIPETVQRSSTTYTVVKVGDYAFYGCTELRGVTLPNTVEEIGNYAFNMSGIEWFFVPDNVSYIGTSAFGNETFDEESGLPFLKWITVSPLNSNYSSLDGVLYQGNYPQCLLCYPPAKEDKKFMLPLSVNSIGEKAFSLAWQLERVFLNNNVTEIGANAFQYCTSLKSVRMPLEMNGEIPEGCFYFCIALSSINLPEGIEAIGQNAFGECYNLQRVVFPQSLQNLKPQAFYNGYVQEAYFLNPIPPEYGVDVFTSSISGGQPTFFIPQGENLDDWPEDIFDSYFPAAGHIWNDFSGISIWGIEDDDEKEELMGLLGISYDLLSNTLVFKDCMIMDTMIPTSEGPVNADELGITAPFLSINNDLVSDLYLRIMNNNQILSRHGVLELRNNKDRNVVVEGNGVFVAKSMDECALLMYGDSQLDLQACQMNFQGKENAAWSNWSSRMSIGGPNTRMVGFEPLDNHGDRDDHAQALHGFGEISVCDNLLAVEGLHQNNQKYVYNGLVRFDGDEGGFVNTENNSSSEGAVSMIKHCGFFFAGEPTLSLSNPMPAGTDYDGNSRTLFLNNAELTTGNIGLIRTSDKPLRIYVKGNNVIRMTDIGISTAIPNLEDGTMADGTEPIAITGPGTLTIAAKTPLSLQGESPVMFDCENLYLYGKDGMVDSQDEKGTIYQYGKAEFVVVKKDVNFASIEPDTPLEVFMSQEQIDVMTHLNHFYLMDSRLKAEGPDGRCHFSEEASRFVYDEGEAPVYGGVIVSKDVVPTGIEEVSSPITRHPTPTYNLQGQRVGKDYRGIVVSNGRKYIKK